METHHWFFVGAVVLVLLVLGLWAVLFRQTAGSADRAPNGLPKSVWDPNDLVRSLNGVLLDVEQAAASASAWYWREKIPKARASRFIQAGAVFLAALAGLVPVGIELFDKYLQSGAPAAPVAGTTWYLTGLWATVLVGAAAGLLGLDRAFGFSSAWARYVLAATEITRRLAEFKMDWLALTAAASNPPTSEQTAALIQKAKDFRIGVETIVVQETKEWATEFRNNLSQLEKEVKTQLEALQLQVQKDRQERETTSRPGSIELVVPTADKTKDFTFFVSLSGPRGSIVTDDKVVNNKTWTSLALEPGQYKLTVAADIAADPAARRARTTVVIVKPNEVAKASVDPLS